eukprot:269615-Prorocentrum_minimum.AAC.2
MARDVGELRSAYVTGHDVYFWFVQTVHLFVAAAVFKTRNSPKFATCSSPVRAALAPPAVKASRVPALLLLACTPPRFPPSLGWLVAHDAIAPWAKPPRPANSIGMLTRHGGYP